MSIVSSFEPKPFGLSSDCHYPTQMDQSVHTGSDGNDPTDHVRYSPGADHELHTLDAAFALTEDHENLISHTPMPLPTPPANSPSPPKANHMETPTPPRLKAVPKPDREVSKNAEGKFVCTWTGCTEATKVFNRKCEWSKHMDKHDRPYKCPADGCELLAGFTYSGGLLRHEREVHNKHGGPKNPLNCPYSSCKRSSGKGFSRQENLNEHLRRCHTSEDGRAGSMDGHEDGNLGSCVSPSEKLAAVSHKRKPDDDLREEVKRLREENAELRKACDEQRLNAEAQKRQTIAMMSQLDDLQRRCQDLPEPEPHATSDLLETLPQ